jgi:hypothetical protein
VKGRRLVGVLLGTILSLLALNALPDSSPAAPSPTQQKCTGAFSAFIDCVVADYDRYKDNKVVQYADCTVSVASLLAVPELRAVKILGSFKTAKGLYDLRKINQLDRPLYKLYNELAKVKFGGSWSGQKIISGLATALREGDEVWDLAELEKHWADFTIALNQGQFDEALATIASLTGLDSCLQLFHQGDKGGNAPPADAAGRLHWTGTVAYDTSEQTPSDFHLALTWSINSFTRERGSLGLEDYPASVGFPLNEYVAAWKSGGSSAQSSCEEPDLQTTAPPYYEDMEGSGSGSSDDGGGEIGFWPHLSSGEWNLTLGYAPAGTIHEFGNSCWSFNEFEELEEGGSYDETFEVRGEEIPGAPLSGECTVAIPEGFTSPGQIVGSTEGPELSCARNPYEFPHTSVRWHLTVTCPDGHPPDESFACTGGGVSTIKNLRP